MNELQKYNSNVPSIRNVHKYALAAILTAGFALQNIDLQDAASRCHELVEYISNKPVVSEKKDVKYKNKEDDAEKEQEIKQKYRAEYIQGFSHMCETQGHVISRFKVRKHL